MVNRGVGVGGCDHVLDECNIGPTEKMDTNVYAAQENPAAYQKKYSWACSWTWRHNVASFESVAVALPKALWH